ncbi:MAG: hypothetical protein J0H74_29575 [Chitinophagaceae bacterium]|nr:hypothetical protein [Chitinophagaceae bacterium]
MQKSYELLSFFMKVQHEKIRPGSVPCRAAADPSSKFPVQGIFKHDGARFSQNAQYGIPDDDPAHLLVGKSTAPPQPHGHFQQTGDRTVYFPPTSTEKTSSESEGEQGVTVAFHLYTSGKPFGESTQPNDCGMYANALAFDKSTWAKETRAGEHLEGMITPNAQGEHAQYDPADNKSKDALSLDIGDMYRMDWDKPGRKPLEKCAHHVATVVAKDGEDHITSEADAGLQIAKPKFEMYGTTKDTFWMAHNAYFRNPLDNQQGPPFASKYQNPRNQK